MSKINSINNSGSNLEIDPGASGDSFIQFDINGTGEFRIGVDDDDLDKFKISQGSALGSNDTYVVTENGEITAPLQPAFLAYLASTDANVVGASAWYTIGTSTALTEVFDQNSDFNTNGTFTAPTTGRYLLSYYTNVIGLTSSHTQIICKIVTSNRQHYNTYAYNPYALSTSNEYSSVCFATLADMDASDTATFQINVYSGTKVADLEGSSDLYTQISGCLVC